MKPLISLTVLWLLGCAADPCHGKGTHWSGVDVACRDKCVLAAMGGGKSSYQRDLARQECYELICGARLVCND